MFWQGGEAPSAPTGHGGRSSRRPRPPQQIFKEEEITQFELLIFTTPIMKTQYKLYFKKQGFLESIFGIKVRATPTLTTQSTIPLRYRFSSVITRFAWHLKHFYVMGSFTKNIVVRPIIYTMFRRVLVARANRDNLIVKELFRLTGFNEPIEKEENSST